MALEGKGNGKRLRQLPLLEPFPTTGKDWHQGKALAAPWCWSPSPPQGKASAAGKGSVGGKESCAGKGKAGGFSHCSERLQQWGAPEVFPQRWSLSLTNTAKHYSGDEACFSQWCAATYTLHAGDAVCSVDIASASLYPDHLNYIICIVMVWRGYLLNYFSKLKERWGDLLILLFC